MHVQYSSACICYLYDQKFTTVVSYVKKRIRFLTVDAIVGIIKMLRSMSTRHGINKKSEPTLEEEPCKPQSLMRAAFCDVF